MNTLGGSGMLASLVVMVAVSFVTIRKASCFFATPPHHHATTMRKGQSTGGYLLGVKKEGTIDPRAKSQEPRASSWSAMLNAA
jgi:hypothetical protein